MRRLINQILINDVCSRFVAPLRVGGAVVFWAAVCCIEVLAVPVKQWDKCFGGRGDDQAYAIQQTRDGGYIVAGTSTSGAEGDKTEASRGAKDYWIVKMDGNGSKQWNKRFGGSGDDEAKAIQQTSDGGYVVAGYSQSGADGDKTEDSRG